MSLTHKRFGFGFLVLLSWAMIAIVLNLSVAQPPEKGKGGEKGPAQPKPPLSASETMLKALAVREIREEIELTVDQAKQISLREDEIRTEVEMTYRKLVDEALEDILSSHQFSRLKQITTQLLGMEALLDPTMVTRLNLSIGQVKQLKAIRWSAASEIEDAKHIFKGKEGEADRFFLEDEIRMGLQEKMLRVLTPQQRTAFEEMQGIKFSAPHIPGVNPKEPKGPKEPKEPKEPKA